MLFLTLPPFVNWYPNEIIDIHPFGVSDSQAWIYVRPAELIALPFLSLALRDPSEITIQYHFPASVAQRPVSGTLVMENYQLAQMKWALEKASQNISPSLPLTLSLPLYFALPPSQFDFSFPLSPPLSWWEALLWNWARTVRQRFTILHHQHVLLL